ncbi:histidine phosphatase family protein [Thalassococcus sp. BH17M4-6]|uniref:histidine phosphatase family protein n=1 Tax=Thalassococcus sp. BH17M4-6 TaxID=3413148 RepID=UPI003BC0764B
MRLLAHFILILGLLWPGIVAANDWEALEQPGAFAIMRHALAPGTGDPAAFDLDDCSTQRNLDDAGSEQARRIGAAFRERGIAFDAVLTSQWCRCRDTAQLLELGPVTEVAAFNSFFRDFDARAAQTGAALAEIDARGGRPIIVTHQVNISALTGTGTRSGEVLVVRRGDTGLDVLGSILIAP